MTTGTQTYKGLAVPLFGESTIRQVTLGTDVLTITSVADSYTAASMLNVNITATSAQTAGYLMGAHVNMNMDGGGTGGQAIQSIAFAADITVDGTFSHGVYGMYIYAQEGSTGCTTGAGSLIGVQTYFAAFGEAMDYRVGFWAASAETSAYVANYDGAFLAECGATGSWESFLVAHGGYPTYFLSSTTAPATGDMFSTDVSISETKTANLKCNIHGTVYYIALFASCAS